MWIVAEITNASPNAAPRCRPTGHTGKTGAADHLRERVRPGEFANRFDQVLVGVGVAGDHAAQRGNHLERKEIVETIEARHVDRGKFKA
jgi:hypothetical protein